jgi:transposase InsO family protein
VSVIDCFSRKVVGWSMRADMQAELVVDALEMAISRRQPAGEPVHHSDQGSQYVATWVRPVAEHQQRISGEAGGTYPGTKPEDVHPVAEKVAGRSTSRSNGRRVIISA